jgi:hypothetical protein
VKTPSGDARYRIEFALRVAEVLKWMRPRSGKYEFTLLMLRLRSNWTTMVARPSAEVEVSEVMPEIVESCRSIGPACCALHYVREKRPLRSTPHSAACI